MPSVPERLVALDFHYYTDDKECIAAIYEAREYVHEHGQASRDEMWEALVLDTTSPSPGREACRSKGYVPKFREWWWDVIITPGFEILPSVESVDDEQLTWRVVPDRTRHEK